VRILLTNDDGIHSPGLAVLEEIAAQLSDDIWVVAPEFDQSGLSHSLSLNDPLRLRQVSAKKFALRGTPSDAIIMAVRRLLADRRPDLVLSGVNAGQNAADDVTYSGTIAGAIEGTLLGVSSIALSQAAAYAEGDRRVPWETAQAHGADVIRRLLAFGFPQGVFYNVNFPNRAPENVGGIVATVQGSLDHRLHIEERRDGRGLPYFWLAYRGSIAAGDPGTDVAAIDQGLISVTPLCLDMTARSVAARLGDHLGREPVTPAVTPAAQ
jgi:5'-nucleotidase